MASTSPIKFIETALLATSPFALSYADPDQKWLIRNHLISLLQDFPNFELSTDAFTHNDGTTVKLLRLDGSLHLHSSSSRLASVPVTIWVHENYPTMAPLVFINPNFQNHINHPFVDTSGFAKPPYTETWEYPRCNLLELTRKLVKIFSNDHPLAQINSISSRISSRFSSASKMEALDRLTLKIHYDIVELQEKAEKEIDDLSKLQTHMVARTNLSKATIIELETERNKLKERVKNLENDIDVLVNWLRVNNPTSIEALRGDLCVEEMFEGVDEKSNMMIESMASDAAIEDVICKMDKAVEEGVLSLGSYLRQVRVLAREQFLHRARAMHERFE